MTIADQEFYLLFAHYEELINDEEVMLLYDVNSSKNLSVSFRKYDSFSLDNMENDECISEFRIEKDDLFLLHDILQIPDRITCYNGTVVSGIEDLCICLKRYAYPCQYLDMIPRFRRPVPELCIINYLLNTMNQARLSPNCLQLCADSLYAKGGYAQFIDVTVRPCCRPGINQRIVYNGRKRVHGIKVQSAVTPIGLIAN